MWCSCVNILHGSWWNRATLPLFDEASFLWKSIIHQKEIFLSAAWLLSFYSKENFHLYCSSPKHSTLMAHISVHSALILQILDSFINQYPPYCAQLYDFSLSLASLLCHHSVSIFAGFLPFTLSYFPEDKGRSTLQVILDSFFETSDPIFPNWYYNYLKSAVCGRMCSLLYTFFRAYSRTNFQGLLCAPVNNCRQAESECMCCFRLGES